MLSALTWVNSSAVKSIPARFEPNAEDVKDLKEKLKHQAKEEGHEEAKDEDMEDAVDTEEKEEETKEGKDEEDLAEFNLDNYDEEDDNAIIPDPEDFVHEDNELIDADEDDSDLEDVVIKSTDNIIIGAHSEEGDTNHSHLDMYIYEEKDENLYVHHDIPLAQFPLCLSWLDYNAKENGNKGSFAAVGSFDPEIQIWDLDVINALDPVCVLGGKQFVEPTTTTSSKKKKKKNKNKIQMNPFREYKAGSHTGAVMGVDWNKLERKYLASSSVDASIKVWDISTQQCVATYGHHKDKVQSISWKPDQASVLLSGSYDRTITLFDGREEQYKQASFKQFFWKTSADCEGVHWTHDPNYFLVNLEDGHVMSCDVRVPQKHMWILAAHSKTVSALSYNTKVPNMFATASVDKTVKIWGIVNGTPKALYTTNLTFPIFSLGFCTQSPFLLAAGGKGDSDKLGGDSLERITILKTYDYLPIQNAFPQSQNKSE